MVRIPPFQPTPAQRRFVEHALASPGEKTVAELCAEADIDPSTYYKWCHHDRFRLWMTQELSTTVLFEGWHIVNLARTKAADSITHFRALFKLLFDLKGQAAFQHWQLSISGGLIGESGLPNTLESEALWNQLNAEQNSTFSQVPTAPAEVPETSVPMPPPPLAARAAAAAAGAGASADPPFTSPAGSDASTARTQPARAAQCTPVYMSMPERVRTKQRDADRHACSAPPNPCAVARHFRQTLAPLAPLPNAKCRIPATAPSLGIKTSPA